MKIVSVVGLHRSGKTTAVEQIIKYLRGQGYSVSSIKDIHQEGFTMEKPGSNSQRHLQASDTYVFARGKHETYLVWNRQLTLNEMLTHMDTDWVVIEGMHEEPLPKVLVARNEEDILQLLTPEVITISGVYSETHSEYKGIPCINAVSDIERLGREVVSSKW